jgi:hypothetical protein
MNAKSQSHDELMRIAEETSNETWESPEAMVAGLTRRDEPTEPGLLFLAGAQSDLVRELIREALTARAAKGDPTILEQIALIAA